MTKAQMIEMIQDLDDDEEVNINELLREREEERLRRIEELEERQHESGFYAFQDTMDMYRNER